MRKPDFFIVGAPRCGTTAMYTYLKQHPDIFMSVRKEPHFFGTDLSTPRLVRDQQKYLALFAGARHEQRAGEASVFYLCSRRAAREIRAFCPLASIIIMLRNPVDMMYSLHSRHLLTEIEYINDFGTALAVEEERKRGLHLPATLPPVGILLYRDVATYRPQIQRYLEVFGWQSVHVILFEDFTNDTARVYRETCAFLGVNPDFEPEFPIVNAHKRIRSQTVRQVLRSPPSSLGQRLVKAVLPRPVRQRLLRRLKRLNTVEERRPPLDPHLRRQLQAEFAPQVEQLSTLLRRDLRHWCET